MPSKMNRTTHKVIEGICIPQVWQFAVPDEWDNDDIVIRNGELFYKDEKQDVPMKFEEVDIFSLAEQKQSDWDVEIIFEDECCSSDEEEDEECDAHPPYRCDGGCGKKMGEGNDDECKRICGDCEEKEEEDEEPQSIMSSKMNSKTHKIITATYEPPELYFLVPIDWEIEDIIIKYDWISYKGEKKDVPVKEMNLCHKWPMDIEKADWEDVAGYFSCCEEKEEQEE